MNLILMLSLHAVPVCSFSLYCFLFVCYFCSDGLVCSINAMLLLCLSLNHSLPAMNFSSFIFNDCFFT